MQRTPDLFDLSGKTALITGAGGLLGPKHAEALIECGARVVLTDHHLDRVVKREAELNSKYDKRVATSHRMDVTNKGNVEEVFSRYDSIDIDLKAKEKSNLLNS